MLYIWTLKRVLLFYLHPRVGVGLQLRTVTPALGHWLTQTLLVFLTKFLQDRWWRCSIRRDSWGSHSRKVCQNYRWDMWFRLRFLDREGCYFHCRARQGWWRVVWRRRWWRWRRRSRFFFYLWRAVLERFKFYQGLTTSIYLYLFYSIPQLSIYFCSGDVADWDLRRLRGHESSHQGVFCFRVGYGLWLEVEGW